MLASQYMQLHVQKEVKSNPKQPTVKKVCATQEGYCEKDVNSKAAAISVG